MTGYNGISLLGIGAIATLGWVLSADRRRPNWRVIGWGIGLQLLFGFLIFRVPAGTRIFLFFNDAVARLLRCAATGNAFLFGRLGLPPGVTNADGESSLGFFLAFQALPTIVFFSALMAILYHWGIMPAIIRGFARVFTGRMRLSGAESLCAASNIFVGIESLTTIRPYLERMTPSELGTVLTAGMATIASSVLGFYSVLLGDVFPNAAGHLISASLLSAPAALVMAKIMIPETETPVTLGVGVELHVPKEGSTIEAIISGAQAGVRLVAGIVALLLAVLGLVAVLDALLGGVGGRLNRGLGWRIDWSLKGLLGYVFFPVTVAMGVPLEDAYAVARLIGERTVATEVAGYKNLAALLATGQLRYPGRSAVMAAYALCGFAHVASLAIFTGGAAALAPSRAGVLARVGPRALVAATLACLMTACVAGVWACGDSAILLGPRAAPVTR